MGDARETPGPPSGSPSSEQLQTAESDPPEPGPGVVDAGTASSGAETHPAPADTSAPAADAEPAPRARPRVKGPLEAAWSPGEPSAEAWTPRPWVPVAERAAVGKAARSRAARTAHATLDLPAGRDPVGILIEQEKDRLADLIPIRHARMADSAFAYYRGAPAVMAADLVGTPRSGLIVQASGDAHISNFGLFGSPERTLVFDANDFDETLPGPWEWDVKRLAASVVIAARDNGFTPADARTAALAGVASYRQWMATYAGMRLLDVWYDRITADDIRTDLDASARAAGLSAAAIKAADRSLEALFTKARGKDRIRATSEMTETVDGVWRITDDPPVVTHIEIPGGPDALRKTFSDYRRTMAENRRELLERYRFVDFALKVVGVGSVGTRCFIVLLAGRDEGDPLILQAKEATESVLEPHVGRSHYANPGERVVVGQRLMQATPDIFLGWTRGPQGRAYYFRQLWDMKGTVDVSGLQPAGLAYYARLCARSLARAHARSGDAIAITAYLGSGDRFDGAVADFAEAYADVNAKDYAAFKAAIADGRIEAREG